MWWYIKLKRGIIFPPFQSRNCHILDDGSSDMFIFTYEIGENEVVRLYPGSTSVETNDPERRISGSVPLKLLLRHAKEVSIEGTDPAFVVEDDKASFGLTASEYIVNEYIRNRICSGYLRESLFAMAWAQLRADVTSSKAVLRSSLFPDYEFTNYESAIEAMRISADQVVQDALEECQEVQTERSIWKTILIALC